MKTLHQLLHEGDPVGRETDLTPEEADGMRRAVLGAAGLAHARRRTVRVMLAVGFSVAIGLGAWLSRVSVFPQVPSRDSGQRAVPADVAKSGRHQLQFASPGGTRIIWVFDSHFDVR
jgi:hypothetical protein